MIKRNKEKSIIVIGASGHAKVVIDVIEHHGLYRIAGLIDDFKPAGQEVYGYTILGPTTILPELANKLHLFGGFIAVGDNWTRQTMFNRIIALLPAFLFISAVHPGAQVGRGTSIGCGSVVMAGAVVNSDCRVGNFCIINTNASLDHDGLMGEFSSLAPGVISGGNVQIGPFSAVGLGAGILEGRKIGKQTVVGAGAMVMKDLPDFCVAYGVPAKVIRTRQAGERYLSTGEKTTHG